MVKYYDCEILYHPKKANSVADASSKNEEARLMSNQTLHPEPHKEFNELEIKLIVRSFANLTIQPTIFYGIKGAK